MRTIVFPFFLICLSSCFRTNYYTVSALRLEKNEKKELVAETDSLKVVYNFNGLKGPLKMTILNKTDQPVEINWGKSSLVVADKVYSYYKPDMTIQGTVTRSYNTGSLEGQVNVNPGIQFLPPNATVTKVPLEVLLSPVSLPDFKGRPQEVFTGKNQTTVKLSKVFYQPETSPLAFRSFLTVRFGQEGKEFYLDHSFYISEIWKTSNTSISLPDSILNSGNVFYY